MFPWSKRHVVSFTKSLKNSPTEMPSRSSRASFPVAGKRRKPQVMFAERCDHVLRYETLFDDFANLTASLAESGALAAPLNLSVETDTHTEESNACALGSEALEPETKALLDAAEDLGVIDRVTCTHEYCGACGAPARRRVRGQAAGCPALARRKG